MKITWTTLMGPGPPSQVELELEWNILCEGNWNILTLTGKDLELVEEAKRYHLDIIGISWTKRRGSETVDLDGGWKLFYSGADPSMSAPASVEILTSPRLSDCVSDWIPLGSRVCMLKLKVLDRSLCLLQVYAPNAQVNIRLLWMT